VSPRNVTIDDAEFVHGHRLQARVSVGYPGLVLFAELSQGLAPKIVQDVMRTITELNGSGVALLIVDQNVRIVLDIADRVYVIHGGQLRRTEISDSHCRHALLHYAKTVANKQIGLQRDPAANRDSCFV